MRHLVAALAFVAFVHGSAFAQQTVTIDAAAWLTGRWIGEGFGGQLEEIWSAPVGGQMIGHFRMVRDGRPIFYELVLMEEHDGGLRYRVKHFDPDFVGWEEKDGFHEFAWVAATPDELRFNGIILRRNGENASDHVIRVRSPDGTERQETLRYRRANDTAGPVSR